MLRVRAKLGLQRLRYLRLGRKLTTSLLLILALFALLRFLPLNVSSDVALEELEQALHLIPRPASTRTPTRPQVKPKQKIYREPQPVPPPPPPPPRPPIGDAAAKPKKAVVKPQAKVTDDRGLARFTRRSDGLMVVPVADLTTGRHPIELLIEEGKRLAKAHEARIPKTLAQAVKLYKELNDGFSPPAGYDKWFTWCQENNVVAWPHPASHKSILPFLSIPGSVLKERIKSQDERPLTSIMAIKDGVITKSEGIPANGKYRVTDITKLLSSVAHVLPDIEGIYFNLNDVADHSITYEVRERSIALAKAGELWPEDEREKIEEHQDKWGWPTNCGPDSPLMKKDGPIPKAGVSKTFIWSQEPSMNHCLHPDHVANHGTLIYQHPKSHPLIPLFSYSTTPAHADILFPALDHFDKLSPAASSSFLAKTDSRIFWRGSTTGLSASKKIPWKGSQRNRLHLLTNAVEGEVEVLVPTQGGGVKVEKRQRKEMGKEWFDIALGNKPVQCDEADGTCAEMAAMFDFRPYVSVEEAANYQYQLDVDGNAWSARYKRLLSSGSVVLKSTIYQEWCSDSLIPWYHYIPVQIDYSDLYDIAAFFSSPSTPSSTPAAIGAQGRKFALERWAWGDVQSYTILLMLEYARALSDDRVGETYMG